MPLLPPPTTPNDTPQSLLTRRGLAYDPYEHAEALGIQVLHRDICKDELVMPREYRTIVVREDLRGAHQRTVLAHGLAHWELMHPDDRPKHEQQADCYAALHLIHPAELADVLAWTTDHWKVGRELGVTQRLLRAYLSSRPAA